MSKRKEPRPPGQLRQSQVITTFGPGSMIDLPKHSVLVAGLDHWTGVGQQIVEQRLTEKLAQLLELPTVQLYAPPPEQDDPQGAPSWITVWQFPEWFIVQDADFGEQTPGIRSRLLVHRKGLSGGKFIDQNKKKRAVVPVRFVRACRRGHISDIDWYDFVHDGTTDCRRSARCLWIDEKGTSGDLSEVWVRCECKRTRPLSDAAFMALGALRKCDGDRPWLGPYTDETCGEPNRLLIRTASNAYFPQILSVISLPGRNEELKRTVDGAWDFLETVESLDDLAHERKKAKVKAALEGFTDNEVLAEIQSRRGPSGVGAKSVKHAELETLIASKVEIGDDRPDGNFLARNLPRPKWDRPWMQAIERVVLVHRLREVVAEVGFTRFEAAAPDIQGELEMGVRRAALAKEISWLPAIENRGEGIFLQFRNADLENWIGRQDVQARGRKLKAGFDSWLAEHTGSHRQFFGVPYIMLHSFAHLLITAVSLECGYPASSIRERIYALPDVGYGILL